MNQANDPLSAITNFLAISPLLGTAGQPTRAQFHAIHAAGYQRVVNLLPHTSSAWLADEETIVRRLGMDYTNIPVIWEAPQPADLDAFFAVLDGNPQQKLFVHCAMNMRVSAFVFLYRVLRLGMPVATAQVDLLKIWQPNPIWQAFMDAQRTQKPMTSER